MKSTQQQPLPTADQLNAHRQFMKDKIAALEESHKDYQKQEAVYKDAGHTDMQNAMNSCASNIWDSRYEVVKVLEEFNRMYPEPATEEDKKA